MPLTQKNRLYPFGETPTVKSKIKLVTWGNPRILVIDDDPSFGRILAQYAKQADVALAFFPSWKDVRHQLARWHFQAAIIDLDLGGVSGIDLVHHLERFFEHLPVILVSQSEPVLPEGATWPFSAKRFLPKHVGHEVILKSAVSLISDKASLNKKV